MPDLILRPDNRPALRLWQMCRRCIGSVHREFDKATDGTLVPRGEWRHSGSGHDGDCGEWPPFLPPVDSPAWQWEQEHERMGFPVDVMKAAAFKDSRAIVHEWPSESANV